MMTSGNNQTVASLINAIDESLPCSLVNELAKNTEEQCRFILDNDCLEDEATIDYVYLVFCKIDSEMRLLSITLVVFLVIVLFLNLSAVADEFLCPSLLTVAKSLRMSDSLAGVTLLAFGNGCPDIFSSLAAASSGRPELIVGELLGAGIFCTSIVAGLIFISTEFKIARRPLLRDTSFYLLAVYMIWLFCSQGSVTFYGALAFIIIYVIYLLTALIGQAVHSRWRGEYPLAELGQANEKTPPPKQTDPEGDDAETSDKKIIYRRLEELMRRRSSGLIDINGHDRKRELDNEKKPTAQQMKQVTTIHISSVQNSPASNRPELDVVRMTTSAPKKNEIVKNQHECEILSKQEKQSHELPSSNKFTLDELDQFLEQINPMNTIDWAQAGILTKLMSIVRAPLLLITTFTVPVVDMEKPNCNWCRLLNSIHCFSIPAALITLTRIQGMSLWTYNTVNENEALRQTSTTSSGIGRDSGATNHYQDISDLLCSKYLILAPSLVLALYIFNTTNVARPPRYHSVFAYFGFFMSVVWIYKLANEIISLLKTVGIIFSMSDTAIGLGFLAWGNSLGDIVANLTLAQAGYARMALGASIGAPLLNLLLGFGLSFTISLKPGESVEIDYNDTMVLLAATLALVLVLLMASTLLPQNRSKKPFGYLLIACYGLYFFLAICLECDFI